MMAPGKYRSLRPQLHSVQSNVQYCIINYVTLSVTKLDEHEHFLI